MGPCLLCGPRVSCLLWMSELRASGAGHQESTPEPRPGSRGTTLPQPLHDAACPRAEAMPTLVPPPTSAFVHPIPSAPRALPRLSAWQTSNCFSPLSSHVPSASPCADPVSTPTRPGDTVPGLVCVPASQGEDAARRGDHISAPPDSSACAGLAPGGPGLVCLRNDPVEHPLCRKRQVHPPHGAGGEPEALPGRVHDRPAAARAWSQSWGRSQGASFTCASVALRFRGQR